MNIEQLRYFQLTASFQHMSKAADVLNISQPALGSNIRRLDEPGCYCSLYMAWCEELLSQKPLAYEIRKIVEEYFVSQVNEYES